MSSRGEIVENIVEAHASTSFSYFETNRPPEDQLGANTLKVEVEHVPLDSKGKLIELKRIQSRPAGCSFLGAKAVSLPASLSSLDGPISKVIIDSGSDITLISEKTFRSIKPLPKRLTGRKISLVQVTGKASITGYIRIPIFFQTPDGPVKMDVEAYIVQGMSTPFILGNDFADQYELSIMRDQGLTQVIFGSSNRRTEAESSTGTILSDKQGRTLSISAKKDKLAALHRAELHRHNKRQRSRIKKSAKDSYIKAAKRVIIPPLTCKKVPVRTNIFTDKDEVIYAESIFNVVRNMEDVYAPPNSLIDQQYPYLHVSNFSKTKVTISVGQPLARKISAKSQLNDSSSVEASQLQSCQSTVLAINAIAKELGFKSNHDNYPHIVGDEPLEGGPKMAEVPPEETPKAELLKEVNFSSDLSAEHRERLEKMILRNEKAFGIDGRLGHYPAKVQIRLQPETKPVSLPPFPQSPANREVMDKQMDQWIQLEVIEPSVSPWGAPAFIIFRNGKPRMVIDYRKLNERVVPDEFPLPRQDDILQALNGAQWLTTLDALSGFTQLEMSDESKEYTAFRSHRGLYQFKRLPFGYRNGPSVFQRVMQEVLAPYLWTFTLVYIDDIVIFSKSFDQHLHDIDKVLTAITKSGLTLSPKKCYFAFQSLNLLGQKVSRLGVSTQKSKIEAICQLAEPTNVKELQTFLGMMVYFSAYIPYYAWIVAPLFKLLKKDATWKWTDVEQEAFELSKQVLTNAPIRAFAMPGRGYRLYTDACDYGLGAILQQVQPILVKDLKGTKLYDQLKSAYDKGEDIPRTVLEVDRNVSDITNSSPKWAEIFENTEIEVERVIAYWSRTLKPAERNYSPTEKEALALKEGLIKFQAYIEGEKIFAITDHAALTWSRTFQNVNRRLLSWGTVFAAYPNLTIVHRAGRVHSNVDPISRLRRRVPFEDSPLSDSIPAVKDLDTQDLLNPILEEIEEQFESKLLSVAARFQEEEEEEPNPIKNTVYSLAIQTRGQKHKEEMKTNSTIPIESVSMIEEPTNPIIETIPKFEETINIQPALQDSTSEDIQETINVPSPEPTKQQLQIYLDKEEIYEWIQEYSRDHHLVKIIDEIRNEETFWNPKYPQYYLSDEGLLYFEDWEGNLRLYVPEGLRVKIIKEDHDELLNGAHSGALRSYYRLSQTYYWPRMMRDIKGFVKTCDICQKVKPRKHPPYGMLKSLPIPSRPFETITMDFIPELPKTANGFDNILVVVDKLTRYAIFIPTTVDVTTEKTAELIFKHVITKFGLPHQIISDRDTRWTSSFWEELCRQMDIKRSLSTSYHPQTDGQTEVMNQILEIALRCYVGPKRDNWDEYLDGFALSYNNTPHSSTNYSPSFLLFGYLPRTSSNLLQDSSTDITRFPLKYETESQSVNIDADEFVTAITAYRRRAQDALKVAQSFQQKYYNKNRIPFEFEEGDQVLINLKTLKQLESKNLQGKKLHQRYEGPYEVIEKLSPVTYRIRLDSSLAIHNVINIAHLEPYSLSPVAYGPRVTGESQKRNRMGEIEWEVDKIIAERRRRQGSRLIPFFRVRYSGFGPEHDEWIPKSWLRNAPKVLRNWERNHHRIG